ncbi:hypothetical protein GXW78_25255 [Roseomonas terrae]|jgi:hypothetical protein|uniref:Uncharacterized protein n=1 Tax=Neoroseomonas terrae TaxID=424799 RepID=A0ABS5EPP6_9PROT|nr:hypothetical protein [Neoroseomonas terrae]MBR0652988.1 hypothetical protein [Neoroseomonas terrae]
MRLLPLLFLAGLVAATAAQAQTGTQPDDPGEGGGGGSVSCLDLGSRAMEATMVIRQHASTLSAGITSDARAEGIVVLAWLDQWTGRLRGIVELAEFVPCFDDGDRETYRRALATAGRVANTARDELLRTPAAAQAPRRR